MRVAAVTIVVFFQCSVGYSYCWSGFGGLFDRGVKPSKDHINVRATYDEIRAFVAKELGVEVKDLNLEEDIAVRLPNGTEVTWTIEKLISHLYNSYSQSYEGWTGFNKPHEVFILD